VTAVTPVIPTTPVQSLPVVNVVPVPVSVTVTSAPEVSSQASATVADQTVFGTRATGTATVLGTPSGGERAAAAATTAPAATTVTAGQALAVGSGQPDAQVRRFDLPAAGGTA